MVKFLPAGALVNAILKLGVGSLAHATCVPVSVTSGHDGVKYVRVGRVGVILPLQSAVLAYAGLILGAMLSVWSQPAGIA